MLQTSPARSTILFYTLLLAGLFVLAAVPAMAQTSPEEKKAREELVANMSTMTLAILQDQSKDMSGREALLKRSFTNVVDTKWIARFVLGAAWRTASEKQKEYYTDLYSRYITNLYVQNYAQSNDRKIRDIKILGLKHDDDERFTARTELLLSTNEHVKVDYLVKKDDGYQIIDVAIEGVSLLASHRAEFSKMAAAGGVDAVISKLERLVHAHKQFAQLH